jgi:hypothetical protein
MFTLEQTRVTITAGVLTSSVSYCDKCGENSEVEWDPLHTNVNARRLPDAGGGKH